LKRNDDSLHAIAVDDIVSQQQVVIKRLDAKLAQLGAFTGGTILGDGKAALLLDLKELTNGIGA
jgi:two-component system chemotaxis sensor kinase CheA